MEELTDRKRGGHKFKKTQIVRITRFDLSKTKEKRRKAGLKVVEEKQPFHHQVPRGG